MYECVIRQNNNGIIIRSVLATGSFLKCVTRYRQLVEAYRNAIDGFISRAKVIESTEIHLVATYKLTTRRRKITSCCGRVKYLELIKRTLMN